MKVFQDLLVLWIVLFDVCDGYRTVLDDGAEALKQSATAYAVSKLIIIGLILRVQKEDPKLSNVPFSNLSKAFYDSIAKTWDAVTPKRAEFVVLTGEEFIPLLLKSKNEDISSICKALSDLGCIWVTKPKNKKTTLFLKNVVKMLMPAVEIPPENELGLEG